MRPQSPADEHVCVEALRTWCRGAHYVDDTSDAEAPHVEAFKAGFFAALDWDWDDAIHIPAPWEPRSGLCGKWNRNLAPATGPRPGGAEGCWTCLLATDWLDKNASTKSQAGSES